MAIEGVGVEEEEVEEEITGEKTEENTIEREENEKMDKGIIGREVKREIEEKR